VNFYAVRPEDIAYRNSLSTDGQGIKCGRNIADIWTAWVWRTSVTDGRAIAYSERSLKTVTGYELMKCVANLRLWVGELVMVRSIKEIIDSSKIAILTDIAIIIVRPWNGNRLTDWTMDWTLWTEWNIDHLFTSWRWCIGNQLCSWPWPSEKWATW